MTQQIDIADILGQMQAGPVLGPSRNKIGELLKHFARGGAHSGRMRGQATSGPPDLNAKAVCLPPLSDLPRLLPAPFEATEGEEEKEGHHSVNKFAADIEARLVIINKMIPAAKPAERRALQRERADLEEKLREVTAA